MPGKQARGLCPVCAEPIPPDETECWNCGAFVIDEAVVRLCRAFGLDREKALKLFEAGFRHTKQLTGRDPNRVLELGETGLLFICTNCGSFVASGDTKCPRCAAEFEAEPPAAPEEDILDIVLCPVCGADNDPALVECEVCGEVLKEGPEPVSPAPGVVSATLKVAEKVRADRTLERVDDFLQESDFHVAAPPPRPVTHAGSQPPPVGATVPPTAASSTRSKGASTATPKSVPVPAPAPPRVAPAVAPAPRPLPPPPPPLAPPPKFAGPASFRETTVVATRTPPPPVPPRAPPPVANVSQSRSPIARPGRSPRRKEGEVGTARRISAETAGSVTLAAAASLFLAGALDQPFVSAGIAALLIGLVGSTIAASVRSGGTRPSASDTILLGVGVALGLAVPAFHGFGIDPTALVAVAVGAVIPFGAATRHLLGGPRRILLAIGAAVMVIGEALATATDPAYPMTLPWLFGILAATPWPLALAAGEVARRRGASNLRRELVAAERDLRSKDYERSLVEYDRAIAVAHAGVPGAEIPWYGKGATLILLGRYDEALRAIDTALDINPRSEVAWVNKGNALTKMGRLVDALRCFNAAIKVSVSYEVAWNNKGNALARLGKFDEAVACYERALQIDEAYRGAWVNMGFVLTKLGRFDEAASCADRALTLNPSHRADPI